MFDIFTTLAPIVDVDVNEEQSTDCAISHIEQETNHKQIEQQIHCHSTVLQAM